MVDSGVLPHLTMYNIVPGVIRTCIRNDVALTDFFSAGARSKITQNYSKSVAPIVKLYGESRCTFYYISINWDNMTSAAYLARGSLHAPGASEFFTAPGANKCCESRVRSRHRARGRAAGGAAAAVRSPTRARAPGRSSAALSGQRCTYSMGQMGGEM